jgi:hypothetical protein
MPSRRLSRTPKKWFGIAREADSLVARPRRSRRLLPLPLSIIEKQQVFVFEQFAQIANRLNRFILARHSLETMPL